MRNYLTKSESGDFIKGQREILGEKGEWYRQLFEQSTLGMAVSDKTFRFIAANPAFCGMLGYKEDELLKLTFKDITHPDNLIGDTRAIYRLTEGVIPYYKTEKHYITKSGNEISGALTVTALRDSDGKFLQSLVVLEDITERKKMEEELRNSNEILELIFKISPDVAIITRLSDGHDCEYK